MQLLIPYQITFGLSSGFINYYVNSRIVAVYTGSGYIGVLSGAATVMAAGFAPVHLVSAELVLS